MNSSKSFNYLGQFDPLEMAERAKIARRFFAQLVAIAITVEPTGWRVPLLVVSNTNNILSEISKEFNEFSHTPIALEDKRIPSGRYFHQQLLPQMMALASDYDIEVPNALTSLFTQVGSTGFTFTANPQINMQQTVDITVQQKVEILLNEIEDNLSPDDMEKVKPTLDEFKKKPSRYSAQKLVEALLGIGGSVLTNVLTALLMRVLKLG